MSVPIEQVTAGVVALADTLAKHPTDDYVRAAGGELRSYLQPAPEAPAETPAEPADGQPEAPPETVAPADG